MSSIFKARKPQTEQQVLARNEGRALGNIGMAESCIRELHKLGMLGDYQLGTLYSQFKYIRETIHIRQEARMKAAGTWKGE